MCQPAGSAVSESRLSHAVIGWRPRGKTDKIARSQTLATLRTIALGVVSAVISVVVVTFIEVIVLIRSASAEIGRGTGSLAAVSAGLGTPLAAAIVGFGLGCWIGHRRWRQPRKDAAT